jgi:hypothetical protein
MTKLLGVLSVAAALAIGFARQSFAQVAPEAGGALDKALADAGTNRTQLQLALDQVSASRRDGLVFLIENMPQRDLQTLSGDFLLENVNLSFDAWETAPWHGQVSRELFFNEVLPYACMTERREDWRKKLHEQCATIVAGCKTPGEAAHLLNQKIFPLFKVKYSTGRRRPDQSPSETIASGIATCTGLSILLVDACRSVGVPARVTGTPMWSNMRGNHTWVEIWDGGWHYAGAAEADSEGLDHGWFTHDASEAKKESAEHSIYSTSFRKTGLAFPMVWSPGTKWVSAVNVTDRYTPSVVPTDSGLVRLLVKVLDAPAGKRVVADVTVAETGNPAGALKAKSRGETSDLNDIASFEVAPGKTYIIAARVDGKSTQRELALSTNRQELVTLALADTPSVTVPSQFCYAQPPAAKALSPQDASQLRKALSDYFAAGAEKQAKWKFTSKQEKLLKENEPAVRLVAWDAYRSAPIHDADKADFDSHLVNSGKYQSPYTVKTVGTRPPNGWALFIAMHGGGGAPKELNDSQWRQMQRYYRDHPEAGGYIYLALRAPNDTWNGFYDDYVYPLVDTLIRQFRLFGDIDPDKVFIMGYSHGGYGAFAIGPKMPDRFAAIHASAAAPTDGETTGKTLRNTVFTVMVGELDTMYGRYERDKKFKADMAQLKGNRDDIYPVTVTIVNGNGHTGLPDRDKIKEMYPAVRNPVPRELTWLMTDGVITDFFWLRVPHPAKQQEILASCRDNRFVVTANDAVTAATVYCDSRLVDFSKPLQIEVNGETVTRRFSPSLKSFCECLLRRGDPEFAFSASFDLHKDQATGRLVLAGVPR